MKKNPFDQKSGVVPPSDRRSDVSAPSGSSNSHNMLRTMVQDVEKRESAKKSVSFEGEEERIFEDDPSSSDTVTGPAKLTGSDRRRAERRANPPWADLHKGVLRSVERNLEQASRTPILPDREVSYDPILSDREARTDPRPSGREANLGPRLSNSE